jgi:hypothetical protein
MKNYRAVDSYKDEPIFAFGLNLGPGLTAS